MVKTVIQFTDAREFGGAEQVLLQILTGLDRQRWRPILFHHAESGINSLVANAQSFDIERRTVPRIDTVTDMARMPTFVRALRAESPAIFHAHLTWPLSCKYALIAAVLARIPVIVVTVHVYVEPPKKRLVYIQLRLIAVAMNRYFAVSHGVAQQLRYKLHIPRRKIQVVHNGISLARFSRPGTSTQRANLFGASGRPVILSVARLEEQKGHRHLIDAMSRIPEAMLILAGSGSERKRLEIQAKELGIADRVLFLGYRDDIPDLLVNCDIFVLPSLFEGLPLSILEAMAAAKPVIATDIDGNKEAIVDGETGLLVPPANPNALVRAIQAVLSDPVFARRLATSAQARVERYFSEESMLRQITETYDELIKSPPISAATA